MKFLDVCTVVCGKGEPTQPPQTCDFVCQKGWFSDEVAKGMDNIKATHTWTINTTIPENLLAWDVGTLIGLVVNNSAPTLGHLLCQCIGNEMHTSRKNNKFKSCTTVWHMFFI